MNLSPRQSEVVALVAKGKMDKEIAAELGISIHAAKLYLRNAMDRLGIHSRVGIALWHFRQQIAKTCTCKRRRQIPDDVRQELLAI